MSVSTPKWVDYECLLTLDSGRSNTIKSNVRFILSVQPVDATHALNLSAGVSKSNVLLGRSFIYPSYTQITF